jgi:hypothetical protein
MEHITDTSSIYFVFHLQSIPAVFILSFKNIHVTPSETRPDYRLIISTMLQRCLSNSATQLILMMIHFVLLLLLQVFCYVDNVGLRLPAQPTWSTSRVT